MTEQKIIPTETLESWDKPLCWLAIGKGYRCERVATDCPHIIVRVYLPLAAILRVVSESGMTTDGSMCVRNIATPPPRVPYTLETFPARALRVKQDDGCDGWEIIESIQPDGITAGVAGFMNWPHLIENRWLWSDAAGEQWHPFSREAP